MGQPQITVRTMKPPAKVHIPQGEVQEEEEEEQEEQEEQEVETRAVPSPPPPPIVKKPLKPGKLATSSACTRAAQAPCLCPCSHPGLPKLS
ncbi:MYO15B isoform 5 [Pongo abelii]|uniref:MYO15B isoform 5 n=1 Tax=Pongo abelii TaxID=9601 RepID=A0A2J8Y0S4_PONAB|nr:MYO15B isoform 5 [Pongo abelii]